MQKELEINNNLAIFLNEGHNLLSKSLDPNNSKKIREIINEIKAAKWRDEPYKRQNWGNWLHRMSAYVGRIKPSMAYWLVKACSQENDIILDPFCGVGTIPLESDFLNRTAIGVDLNPYAYSIARAKFDRTSMEDNIAWLDSLNLKLDNVKLDKCSSFMKKFYDNNTLKEIIFIRDKMIENKRFFLLGCLLGIIHGHRPGHLSAVTSLVIPYDPKTKPEYREVIPRLKQKIKRMYSDGFSLRINSQAIFADARKLPIKEDSVDLVISSPPYFNTLDYVADNRLRLEFLGYNEIKKDNLKKDLIQNKNDYIQEMKKVGEELRRVIKKGGLCIFILGDLHLSNRVINTAKEISEAYEELGFKTHEIIEDAMPINKCIPSIYKRLKLDRILVMTNEKE
jgi:DNA modification methylase